MSMPADAVLVGYDGSPDSQRGLAWAARASERHARALHVIVAQSYGLILDAAATELTEEARDLAAAYDVGSVTTAVIEEDPAPALIAAAQDASMVVVGSRGHSRMAGALVGSVSRHLAHHAPCTAVVVRAPHDSEATRIVVGVDGSPGGERALAFAFAEARRVGAPLTAVHAWSAPPAYAGPSAGVMSLTPGDEAGLTERLLSEALAEWVKQHPDVELTPETTPLHPKRALVDASHRAALVVVGAHGRGAFTGLLLGSVGDSLLHQASCPVAIAR